LFLEERFRVGWWRLSHKLLCVKMGCGNSGLLIAPDASQPSNVIHFTSNKKSIVTPLPPNHAPLSASASVPSASDDTSGLVYQEKQSNHDNLVALCKKGKLSLIQELVEKSPGSGGVDLNMKGMWSNTPLIAACQYNHPEIALYLLQFPALDLGHSNEHGATALLFACLEGLDAVVEKLLSMGCSPNSKAALVYNSVTDRSDYLTPLVAAIVNGHLSVLQRLLSAGCDLNLKISQKSDQVAVVEGKKVKMEVQGLTPLMIACKHQHCDILRYLLTATDGGEGFDYLAQDSEGFTALHHLCRVKRSSGGGTSEASPTPSVSLEMLTLFLSAIAPPPLRLSLLYIADMKGSLPIHIATESSAQDLAEYLLKTEELFLLTPSHSVKQVSSLNGMGYTPLHIAIKKRCTEVVRLLLAYGSDPFQPLVSSEQHRSHSQPSNAERCAYDAAMKLRQTTDIYQLLLLFNQNQSQNQERELIVAAQQPLTISLTRPQSVVPETPEEGDRGGGHEGEGDDEQCTGQEMRIHEIVSSLSSSYQTPKLINKPGAVTVSTESVLSTAIISAATSLVDHVMDSSYHTPLKAKGRATPAVPQTPLKGTEERNGKGDLVRLASPLLFSDEILTLVSP
jgi:ankyrin repeat protein